MQLKYLAALQLIRPGNGTPYPRPLCTRNNRERTRRSKLRANRPDILVYDKKRREILIIEIGITSQDMLTRVESEKTRKYDVLANEQVALYKCKARIIPYVMTWDGVVTNCHKKHIEELEITPNVEAYIQTRVLKMTLEAISFEYRRDTRIECGSEQVLQGGNLNNTSDGQTPIPTV